MPTIYISHARTPEDYETASRLAYRLRELGADAWMAETHLRPGAPIREEMDRAVAESDAALVVVGTGMPGKGLDDEVRRVLDEAYRRPTYRVLPIVPSHDASARMPASLADFQSLSADEAIHGDGLERLLRGIRVDTATGAASTSAEEVIARLQQQLSEIEIARPSILRLAWYVAACACAASVAAFGGYLLYRGLASDYVAVIVLLAGAILCLWLTYNLTLTLEYRVNAGRVAADMHRVLRSLRDQSALQLVFESPSQAEAPHRGSPVEGVPRLSDADPGQPGKPDVLP